MAQTILTPEGNYAALARYLPADPGQKIFLVCGPSFARTRAGQFLEEYTRQSGIEAVRFSGFHPNPEYESVAQGAALFRRSGCTALIGAGGGSAMDVAKCIRKTAGVPLLVIPTTAGSGSEATHFAVVYRNGVKESVDCGLPDAVLLDPSALEQLPEHVRKSTLLDALCHGIESCWSVRSTPESRSGAGQAIRTILDSYQGYLRNTPEGNAGMMRGAHLAGRAINVSQTTAGHAMCYQITKRFGLAHGHAAALCAAKLWPFLLEQCAGPRDSGHLAGILEETARYMGVSTPRAGAERFQAILDSLELEVPSCSEEDLAALTASVNPERLRNFPVPLSQEDIGALYRNILRKEE